MSDYSVHKFDKRSAVSFHEEELQWLIGILSKPINIENPNHEDPVDTINRREITNRITPIYLELYRERMSREARYNIDTRDETK